VKNFIVAIIFCVQICFVDCTEDHYLINIENALNASSIDGFKPLEEASLVEEINALFLKIYHNENKYPDTIACLTAQDSIFYAYQVIAKELYIQVFGAPREDFEFLRFPTQKLLTTKEDFFNHFPSLIIPENTSDDQLDISNDSLLAYFDKHEKEEEAEFVKIINGEEICGGCEEAKEAEINFEFQICDTAPEISRELISVNFSLETYRPLDSVMFVFLSGKSVALVHNQDEYKQKFIKIFSELFEYLYIPNEKLVACLEELIEKAPRSKFGIINQIFIPKDSVEKCLYLSFSGGFLHSVYDANFDKVLLAFQNSRTENPFRTFRDFQARIIAGALFEDPQVKILRYTLFPKEIEQEYEALVRDSILKLLTN